MSAGQKSGALRRALLAFGIGTTLRLAGVAATAAWLHDLSSHDARLAEHAVPVRDAREAFGER